MNSFWVGESGPSVGKSQSSSRRSAIVTCFFPRQPVVGGEQQVVRLVEEMPGLEALVDRQPEGGEVEHRRHVQLARANVLDELVAAGLDQASA